jgi:uncharacterized protein (TIGR03067 family)
LSKSTYQHFNIRRGERLMKLRYLSAVFIFAATLFGCATERQKPPISILGESPRTQARSPIVDSDLTGVWQVLKAEMAGKPMQFGTDFELKIVGDRYATGVPSGYSDRGRIELFGDELAGQARRMDVIGEVGMNKGKRFPALYRVQGRTLEVVYDLSGANRPNEFVSVEGTQLFRATYQRK